MTNTYVIGYTDTGIAVLDNDATDKNTVDLHEDTFAAVDCSGHHAVKVMLKNVCTNASDLNIQFVTVRCYYAA